MMMMMNVDMQVWLYTHYSMRSTGLSPQNLSSFYWDIITLWSEVGNTTNRDKREFIWYNKVISSKGTVLVDKYFLRAGIWYIDDCTKNMEKRYLLNIEYQRVQPDTEASNG